MPNGTVHSGCIDPTQATGRLVIVLVGRIQKSGTGDNNFVKIGPIDRDNLTGQSGQSSKLVPNIPVEPNRNGTFHLMCQLKFPEFWFEWKVHKGSYQCHPIVADKHRSSAEYSARTVLVQVSQ